MPTYYHPSVGKFHLAERANARSIKVYWRKNELWVTKPPYASGKDVVRFLDEYAERIKALRPRAMYADGDVYEFDLMTLRLSRQTTHPGRVLMRTEGKVHTISVWHESDFSDPAVEKALDAMIMSLAKAYAPRLRFLAANETIRTGVRPRLVKISYGRRTLGHCSSKGEIALSSVVVFLPVQLQRYIILHEFAHLTEMNHSERFNALADSYMDGREKALERQLKAFKWPIRR